MGLEINRSILGKLSIGPGYGNYGMGFYILGFEVELSTYPREHEVLVLEMGGALSLRNGESGRGSLIGHAQVDRANFPHSAWKEVRERTMRFEFELDHSRMEAIERVRDGNSLNLNLDVWMVVAASGKVACLREACHTTINQSAWIEILERMGYSYTMLLELPIPGGESSFGDASSHLKAARALAARGQYREAVGTCRDALESISRSLEESDAKDSELKKLFEGSRSWDKEKRLGAVRHALKILAHPSRHVDDIAVEFDWSRDDASAVITIVGAVLRMLSATK